MAPSRRNPPWLPGPAARGSDCIWPLRRLGGKGWRTGKDEGRQSRSRGRIATRTRSLADVAKKGRRRGKSVSR